MLWRNNQLPKAPKKKYKNIIIVELKDTWPEIIKSQELE